MSRSAKLAPVIVGAMDHDGWAALMTVAADGTVLDRRRIDLLDPGLPTMPHHHDGQKLPIDEAVALVGRVRECAARNAKARLAALAAEVPAPIAGIALRACPPLPETVAERIRNYRAMCVADWVMYRQTLAAAATERGWFVHWYDARSVFAEAANALERDTLDGLFSEVRAALGPPWTKDQKTAMAAAIAAARATRSGC